MKQEYYKVSYLLDWLSLYAQWYGC